MALSASLLLISLHFYLDNSEANKMKSIFYFQYIFLLFFPCFFYSAFECRGLSAERESQKFTVGEVGTSLALYFPLGKKAGFYNVKSIVLLKTNVSCPAWLVNV